MNVTVPATPKKFQFAAPPQGWHTATIEAVGIPADAKRQEDFRDQITWKLTAERRTFRVFRHREAMTRLGDVLAKLGYTGTVNTDDLIGTKAEIKLRTRGNRKVADIVDVRPLSTS